MSHYRMDIRGDISANEYSNIYDYLNVVDKDDRFIITFNKDNNANVNMINSMLKDNEFIINSQGYDKRGNYFIKTYKNK